MYSVVIIEDSTLLRQGMILTFDWHGLSCEVVGDADNGLDGLSIIRELKPDIVITDIRMPAVDGLEMIEKLREEGSKAFFILISAYNEFEFAQRAIRFGVTEFLVKPFANADLVRALECAATQVEEQRRLEDLHDRVERMEQDKLTAFGSYVPEEGGIKAKYVQMAVTYIEENYAQNIGVSQVADFLSMSEGHLSKVFKEVCGCTVGDYIIKHRVAEACRRLVRVGARVNEVAQEVGYNDQRYFSVVFKRTMGMTPHEFRSKYRTQEGKE
ncbi:response regulator [Eubacteriales bacterium OttesenSCG-928-K08]|nr:response regulator [Eubacteriales bacterium OttesenSCG-928-K08]